ncbi:Vesicle transport protein GOT1 [Camellia lanceoleosa]|uniref:Vesicle transport protein GOT1 n=1 Tax=Camellia lanceoleosa TaxID=1840588 RepID=A0ACC0GAR5_9ERIC|nr:Vesicle transport protein GOT1 [Camellia lanceoleosa]
MILSQPKTNAYMYVLVVLFHFPSWFSFIVSRYTDSAQTPQPGQVVTGLDHAIITMKKVEMVVFMLPPDLGYEATEMGLGLIAFGILFSFLGTILFFDKGLLVMGNILFSSRVTLTVRPKSLMQFFMKCSNFKVGTNSFGVGFFLVVIGWAVLGIILETYGFIVFFSRFWPTLSVFVQKIPIIEWVFQ